MENDLEKLILSNVEDNIGYIIFNRPKQLNAFNVTLAEKFIDIMELFSKDKTVRAVVIKGVGKIFSSGGDIKSMMSMVQEGKDRAEYFRAPLDTFNKMILSIKDIPKPVLAAVHGAVAGVAFNLMLACDLKIATEETLFTQAFIKLGLSPDGGGTYFLQKLVGYSRACELTMLPTEINAKIALNWGLINWVVPTDIFEKEIKNIADKLANSPTSAIGRTKFLLNRVERTFLSEQLEAERLMQIENAATDNFEEGLKAFIEKRPAKFNNCNPKFFGAGACP